MKKLNLLLLPLLVLVVSLSSCKLVGDIFGAGVKVGVFLVVGVIILVIFLVAKMFGGGK